MLSVHMSLNDITIAHDIIEFQFALCTVQINAILDCPTSERSARMSRSNHF